MRVLILDTETSGLDPQWNVILQLSYQIVDSDSWVTKKTVNHFFTWPENKARVSEEAISVNGLTEEFLSGKQLSNRKQALEEFVADKDSCDLLVAHNLEFDKKFILASCREDKVRFASSGWSQSYDTMKRTINYCQIPKDWGNGYKWPKLTELADCLGIDYSQISLHDSSGDVELTKQCFKKLVTIGEYSFPQETDMTITLHVESPDELHFVVKRNGEPVSQSTIDRIPKKSWNAARQELIRKWSEENDEERNDLIHIYRKAPKLKTKEDLMAEIESIKPEKYIKKVFEEEVPSKSLILEELEQEAKEEVSSWMFWTLAKKRQEYVDARIESYYQQRLDAYNQRVRQHEEKENKTEGDFNLQSQKRCEERKQRLRALSEGTDIKLLEEEILRVPDAMSLSFPYHVDARIDGTTINVNLSLPQAQDLPHLEGVRLASGNYKIKEIPDKNKKKDYSEWVWGIAVYVASYYFNVSPLVNFVTIKGNVPVDSDIISVYEITFDRKTYGSLDLENTEIEVVLSHFSVSGKLTKDVLAKLFVVKETEPESEPEKKSECMHSYMRDTLFNDAARLVVQQQDGSAALLQRKFQIGFSRAGAIMEQLEKAGIVGILQGSNPRDVLVSSEQELEDILNQW